MLATDKQIEGHYAVQEIPFGRVYKWCPEHVSNVPTPNVPEELADEQLIDEVIHPWRYAKDREDASLPV